MHVWLDDQYDDPNMVDRHPPTGYVGTASIIQVARWVKEGKVNHISFDHDLGSRSPFTGYTLAKFIEKLAHTEKLPNCISYSIHSANPVGAKNIRMAMDSALNKYLG